MQQLPAPQPHTSRAPERAENSLLHVPLKIHRPKRGHVFCPKPITQENWLSGAVLDQHHLDTCRLSGPTGIRNSLRPTPQLHLTSLPVDSGVADCDGS